MRSLRLEKDVFFKMRVKITGVAVTLVALVLIIVFMGIAMGEYNSKIEFVSRQLDNALNDLTNALPNPKTHPIKLRVANGQVILLEARSIPPKKSPLQLIYDNWDITSEYQVLPIPDCMLRGMLELAESAELGAGINLVADKQGNEEVTLKSENVPPHMHHSSVTTGQGFTTMTRDPSNNSYYIKGNTTYDMFYNDSLDVGLSKNELDGTIDGFSVDGQGRNDGGDVGNPVMSHDNMPKYQAFYGFVVKKIT